MQRSAVERGGRKVEVGPEILRRRRHLGRSPDVAEGQDRIAADAAARPAIDIVAAGTLARNVAARCLLGVGALRRDQDKERARKDRRREGGACGRREAWACDLLTWFAVKSCESPLESDRPKLRLRDRPSQAQAARPKTALPAEESLPEHHYAIFPAPCLWLPCNRCLPSRLLERPFANDFQGLARSVVCPICRWAPQPGARRLQAWWRQSPKGNAAPPRTQHNHLTQRAGGWPFAMSKMNEVAGDAR